MTPWVRRLILANVAMFFLSQVTPSLNDLLEFVPGAVLFRPWTVFTYMFLHAGLGHIFFNMLSLLIFGPAVETRLGGERFLMLYFLSGLTGAMLSLLTPHVAIVGASGAISGVALGYAKFWPRNRILLYGVIPVEAWLLVVIYAGLSLLGGFGIGQSGIAHFAHLGGFLGGYLYLKWLERFSGSQKFRRVAAATPRPKVSAGAPERWARIERENLHEVNRTEYDRIMEKMKSSGVGGLSPGDVEFLERFSGR